MHKSEDDVPNIIQQDDFILWLRLQNGNFYNDAIWPVNRFIIEGINEVLNQRVAFNTKNSFHGKSYEYSVFFTDIQVKKPSINDVPMTPLMAQERKTDYAARIFATLHFQAWNSKRELVVDSSYPTFISDFLIPIGCNACTLMDMEPDHGYDPAGYVKASLKALENNSGDLAELDVGVYILSGNLNCLPSTKDMASNRPFISVSNIKGPTLYCNVLCTAPKTNSVNLSLSIEWDKDVKFILKWYINSPPILNVRLSILALFYMIGIFNKQVIITSIMSHIKEEDREECLTKLYILIENSTMNNINNIAEFQNALYNECVADKKIVETVNWYVPGGLTPAIAMELFDMRYLPNIKGKKMTTNKLNFIASISALMLVNFNSIEKLGSTEEMKEKISASRRSMKSARIDGAFETLMSRFSRATYVYCHKAITPIIELEVRNADGDMSKMPSNIAELLAKAIDSTSMSRDMLCKSVKRTNIHSDPINVETFKLLDGRAGIIGITLKCSTIQMFRQYSKAGVNLDMRSLSHDTVGIICPHVTSEGNPGATRSLAISVLLSFPETPLPKVRNAVVRCIKFCNHSNCMKVRFDSILIGTVCNIHELHVSVRALRKKPGMRFISMEYDEEMNVFNIGYQEGHPFLPLVSIHSHLEEEIAGTRTSKHIHEIKLTAKMCDDVLSGNLTVDDLIQDGVIEYVSANEMGYLYICESLEKFIEVRDDPLAEYDFLILKSQYLSMFASNNLNVHNVPSQRNAFQSSQMKTIVQWGNFDRVKMKKISSAFNTEQPLGGNISSFMMGPSQNTILAFMADDGSDEEGSVFNSHSISLGLCMHYLSDIFRYTIRPDEKMLVASEIKIIHPPYINKDGFPDIGTLLNKGDPMVYIGSSQSGTHTVCQFNQDLEGVVTGCRLLTSKGNVQILEIYYTLEMPLGVTGKVAHATGNKSIVSKIKDPWEMLCMANGMRITMILPTFMCPKRDINDAIVNGNAWATIEFGILPYYHPYTNPKPMETSDKFKSRMMQTAHSTFYLINPMCYVTTMPMHVCIAALRRLDKYGPIEGYVQGSPKMDPLTKMPKRGAKGVSGSMVDTEMNKTCRIMVGAAGLNKELITDRIEMKLCKICGSYMVNNSNMGIMCQVCYGRNYDVVTMSKAMDALVRRMLGCRINITPITYTPGITTKLNIRN